MILAGCIETKVFLEKVKGTCKRGGLDTFLTVVRNYSTTDIFNLEVPYATETYTSQR
jgi:hypothetical protein